MLFFMAWYSEYWRFTLNTEVEKCGNDLVFRVFAIYSEYGGREGQKWSGIQSICDLL